MATNRPERRFEDQALDAASAMLRSRGGLIRRHRGKVGLAVGLAAGLIFTPRIQCTVVGEPRPAGKVSAAPPPPVSKDPEVRARVFSLLACRFDENGMPVCMPLDPEMLDEFGEGCELPEEEFPPECFPGGAPQGFHWSDKSPRSDEPGVEL